MISAAVMPKLKDYAVFAAWIAGILLIGSLSWFLTQSLRTDFLMRSVDRALSRGGYTLSLGAPIPTRELPPRAVRMGQWFSPEGTDSRNRKVLVFAIVDGGVFFPCAALVDSSGTVEDIIPLNGYSGKFLARLSPGVIRFYQHRIEAGNASVRSAPKEGK